MTIWLLSVFVDYFVLLLNVLLSDLSQVHKVGDFFKLRFDQLKFADITANFSALWSSSRYNRNDSTLQHRPGWKSK
jgi:hypothetical protein